ncbi:transglycosylase domain-containing protein [Rheinheimera sp. F8]|uniref:transglycosylase domain-containing protein n=1 Tax=Rheinheimera sp. F8 TaxID=1763998 RepID=UPI0007448718|nr:transglycosylase domain-containing protein [Rheinheimera sp. F8]ALZ75160.1 glycosyl transferase family 51 [Rheinheimera sp. F8]ALZ76415.1 glycosyl transferase family 51 [Rheinheimera sp. F8]
MSPQLPLENIQFDNYREQPAGVSTAEPEVTIQRRSLIPVLLLLLLAALAVLAAFEMRTAWYSAKPISEYAKTLTWQLQSGPTTQVIYPTAGPFDERHGYTKLPTLLPRLTERGFVVRAQAEFSPAMQSFAAQGFFPPYREKVQSGLFLADCRNETIFDFNYPQRVYRQPQQIPLLVAHSLLFIENRNLLTIPPHANPVMDWPRFVMAAVSQVGKVLAIGGQSAGGSTLATQIEKFRHSPMGLTQNFEDKAIQIISGTIRAYQHGPNTQAVRTRIVQDYLNTVPLSSAPGHGEVHGVGDALYAWFGTDFERANLLLSQPEQADSAAERARYFRQMLSLMIAQRRPSYYLLQGHADLEELTDSHIRLLARAGIIDAGLRDKALNERLTFVRLQPNKAKDEADSRKGINAARLRLGNLLNQSMYDLDRLDLNAHSTLHGDVQQKVSAYLKSLANPNTAAQHGLIGERLLAPTRTADVLYSFTLFEKTADANRVRVQTDSTDQPFDLNEHSKLELGSTAKLRVLSSYLEIIAELHQAFVDELPDSLLTMDIAPNDHITRWAANYMATTVDRSLPAMLEASLERTYSASPAERFFTGGGLQVFNNFNKDEDGKVPTIRQSLQQSHNLPFVRLLRDIVSYASSYQTQGSTSLLLRADNDPKREEYLRKFVDKEGSEFLRRFFRKYQQKPMEQRLETFFDGLKQTPDRLAAVHRYLLPDASFTDFAAFLRTKLPDAATLTNKKLQDMYAQYGPGKFSLPDQGYIAGAHPLELWVLNYLNTHPQATMKEVIEASAEQRQQVYRWLFKTPNRKARDARIRIMLEVEAFTDIHQRWAKLGYPFDHLVPSLGTALGSSGDRPAALAELMGIIQNDGIRLPTIRIDSLHFAAHTPYEVQLGFNASAGERVMRPEVARALKKALGQVVAEGTARRLNGSFVKADGSLFQVGGKTGTGDNRVATQVIRGKTVASTATSRTATFVFYLGDSYFGTLTAFVPGKGADDFSFTSALPLQVLKGMAPILRPYVVKTSPMCQPLSR